MAIRKNCLAPRTNTIVGNIKVANVNMQILDRILVKKNFRTFKGEELIN